LGKNRNFCFFSLILIVFFSFFAGSAGAQLKTAPNTRQYLPGDFVQVIVEAPLDTAQITATMPDSTVISLVQERVTGIWRGVWQVPVDFKKGQYFAKLSAVDLSGDVFDGQTDFFTIGELALITLTQKETKKAVVKPPLRELIKAETPPAGASEAEIIKKILKVISQPATTPAPQLAKEEKTQLIERNMVAGKAQLTAGHFSQAAGLFQVVLYLDPANKDASLYLSQAQENINKANKIKDENDRRVLLLIVAISAGVILAFALIIWLIISLRRPAAAPLVCPPGPIPEAEFKKTFFEKLGWTDNPFIFDTRKGVFAGTARLELEGLKTFIKTRIESVGGKKIEPFTDTALEKVHQFSKGKPEAALSICDWALTQAIRGNQEKITAELVNGYSGKVIKTILIADDEELVRSTLAAILEKGGGYNTDFAYDGEEALKKIKENVYGAVLLDIEMPKLTGYEVLKRTRALYPSLPIIFVSGKGKPEKTFESLTQYNLNGYIEKPFSPAKVLEIIARALKT